MRLQIRGSQGVQFDIETNDDSTILDLKKAIAELRSLDASKIRLIYSGKILADNQTLESYHIADGHAIHMVVSGARAAKPAAAAPQPAPASTSAQQPNSIPSAPLPQATPPPQQNPFGGAGMGGMGGFPGMGSFPGMGGMPNMEQLQQMMNSPYVQQMMEQIEQNPDLLRQMIDSNPMFANNPMMRQMADQLASNPEMLRQAMEMMNGSGGANPFGMDFNAMMQNPEVQRMMNDPQVMQQAMNMMGGMGGVNPFANPFAAPAAPATPSTSSNSADRELLIRMCGLEDNADLQTRLSTPDGQNGLRQLLAGARALRRAGIQVFPGVDGLDAAAPSARPAPAPAPAAPTISNEERFAEQLRIMNEMGLNDNTKNIQALLASNGNVNVAIERIFSGM